MRTSSSLELPVVVSPSPTSAPTPDNLNPSSRSWKTKAALAFVGLVAVVATTVGAVTAVSGGDEQVSSDQVTAFDSARVGVATTTCSDKWDTYANAVVTNNGMTIQPGRKSGTISAYGKHEYYSGKHTWDITVDKASSTASSTHEMVIGVATDTGTNGFFMVSDGYGYARKTGNRVAGVQAYSYGVPYGKGDVVTVVLNLKKTPATLAFKVNGVGQGQAYTLGTSSGYRLAIAFEDFREKATITSCSATDEDDGSSTDDPVDPDVPVVPDDPVVPDHPDDPEDPEEPTREPTASPTDTCVFYDASSATIQQDGTFAVNDIDANAYYAYVKPTSGGNSFTFSLSDVTLSIEAGMYAASGNFLSISSWSHPSFGLTTMDTAKIVVDANNQVQFVTNNQVVGTATLDWSEFRSTEYRIVAKLNSYGSEVLLRECEEVTSSAPTTSPTTLVPTESPTTLATAAPTGSCTFNAESSTSHLWEDENMALFSDDGSDTMQYGYTQIQRGPVFYTFKVNEVSQGVSFTLQSGEISRGRFRLATAARFPSSSDQDTMFSNRDIVTIQVDENGVVTFYLNGVEQMVSTTGGSRIRVAVGVLGIKSRVELQSCTSTAAPTSSPTAFPTTSSPTSSPTTECSFDDVATTSYMDDASTRVTNLGPDDVMYAYTDTMNGDNSFEFTVLEPSGGVSFTLEGGSSDNNGEFSSGHQVRFPSSSRDDGSTFSKNDIVRVEINMYNRVTFYLNGVAQVTGSALNTGNTEYRLALGLTSLKSSVSMDSCSETIAPTTSPTQSPSSPPTETPTSGEGGACTFSETLSTMSISMDGKSAVNAGLATGGTAVTEWFFAEPIVSWDLSFSAPDESLLDMTISLSGSDEIDGEETWTTSVMSLASRTSFTTSDVLHISINRVTSTLEYSVAGSFQTFHERVEFPVYWRLTVVSATQNGGVEMGSCELGTGKV